MVGTAPVSSTRKEVFNENDVNTIRQGIQGRNGVFSGCAVSFSSGLVLTIDSGTVFIAGVAYSVSGTTKTMAPHASLDMQALVYYDASTGITVLNGTPEVADSETNYFEHYAPVPPTLPAGGILLAQVYLPAAATVLSSSMILDKRIFVRTSVTIPSNGVFNFYASDGATLLMQLTEPEGNLYIKGRFLRL